MIRTAEAAGIDAVILGEGTGDLYNPKVIRSAQGSHFHIHIETGNLSEWIDKLKEQNIHVYGTALENAVPFKDVSASDSFAVLVGNEGRGVAPELLKKNGPKLVYSYIWEERIVKCGDCVGNPSLPFTNIDLKSREQTFII